MKYNIYIDNKRIFDYQSLNDTQNIKNSTVHHNNIWNKSQACIHNGLQVHNTKYCKHAKWDVKTMMIRSDERKCKQIKANFSLPF